MVRVYKTKRGCLRGEAIRRSKIFDYSDDCKLLVFKVLARMRTWELSGFRKISLDEQRASAFLHSNFLPRPVTGGNRNLGGTVISKQRFVAYALPPVSFQLKTNAPEFTQFSKPEVHLSFFKNLNELFLNRWGAGFLFNSFLKNSAGSAVLLKSVFHILLGVFGTVWLLLMCVCTVVWLSSWNGVVDFNIIGSQMLGNLAPVSWELWYFLDFSYSWWVFWFNDLLCFVEPTVLGRFHVVHWSLKSLFADWEILYAHTEIFNSIADWLVNTDNRFFFMVGVFGVIALLYVIVFGIKVALMRSDSWLFFFNFSYSMTTSHKFDSLESVNQAVYGNLAGFAKNKRLLVDLDRVGVVDGTPVDFKTPFNKFCLEYYCTQTIGGVLGFFDLFPSSATYYNNSVNLRIKLKTFKFFNRIRVLLTNKITLMGLEDSKKASRLAARKLSNLKYVILNKPGGFIPTFLRPKFYLESDLSYFFRWFGWLQNVSRLGDYGVFKMRHYFFKKAVLGRDPWEFFDNEGIRDSGRTYSAALPQKINWYGRELNSVVVSQTIISRFTPKSLFRFKVTPRNLLNDFSFWKPEINLTGRQTYFSRWDSFLVENQFDINSLGATKFGAFERSAAGDEDDESQLEYVIDDAEIYFEDGLLHKDFELVFFDDDLEELSVRGQLDPLFTELNENPKLRALLNNESLIYRAGQEGDHLEKTTFNHYNHTYSLEYGGLRSYNSGVFESFYDDIADFLAVNGPSILPTVTGIPTNRSFFYWGGGRSIYSALEKNERIRLGRLFYSYWTETATFLTPNYFFAWRWPILMFWVSVFSWFCLSIAASLWFFSEFLHTHYSIFDVSALFFVFAIFLVLCFFIFLILVIKEFALRVFYAWRLVSLFGGSLLHVIRLVLRFLHFSQRKVNFSVKVAWFFFSERGLRYRDDNVEFTLPSTSLNLKSSRSTFPSICRTNDPGILQFFFLTYTTFFVVSSFYGISEYKFFHKNFHPSNLTNKFPIRRELVEWGVSANKQLICLRPFILQMQSQTAVLYRTQESGVVAGASITNFSRPLCFYDFSVFRGLSRREPNTFLFNALFSDPLRVLAKLKLISDFATVNGVGGSGLVKRYYLSVLDAIRDVKSPNVPLVWATALSDIVLTSITPSYTLLVHAGRNLFKTKGAGLISSDTFQTAHSRKFRSRTRSPNLHFFESRAFRFSGFLHLAAYENFLRLFFSKEVLRETYRLRTNRPIRNMGIWSYTSKLKFVNFATPLQEDYYRLYKNKL